MNKRRFNEFKSDLKEAFGLIIQHYPDAKDFVNHVGGNLGSKYPELVDGEQQEPLQTRDEQKYEKVSKELSLNLNLTRNKDYQGIEIKSYWRLKKEDCLLFIFTRRIVEACERGDNTILSPIRNFGFF